MEQWAVKCCCFFATARQ